MTKLVSHLTSAPVFKVVWLGSQVVYNVRKADIDGLSLAPSRILIQVHYIPMIGNLT